MHNFPIPNTPSLAGATLNVQSAVVNIGFNALGVTTSNGIAWTADVN